MKRFAWFPRPMRIAPPLDHSRPAGPVKPRTALLINPFYAKDPHASFGKHVLTPTLALTSVAASTPPDWDVAYWDENLLQGPPPCEPMPQVVGISVHLTFAERAYELAAWYRRRGAKVVLGGLHVLSCPDEAAPHADALAVGYLATDGLHMPYLMRDVEQIVEEFRADGQPYGVFVDNNLGSRPDYLFKLCRALRPVEKIWSAAVSIDVTDDPSLVREMALAGCTGVFVGFESLENENITAAHKKSPRTDDYGRRVEILHRNGIQVNGSFVLGFDHDRPNVFAKTVDWIEQNRLECATFHILTPYPGTPLFAQMESEGRILHKQWSRYDTGHVVFRPKHMTADELAAGYAWCYQRLFSHRSIWRRRPRDRSAVVPYLAMSYLYKRSNPLWHFLIRNQLTGFVWRPLVEGSRRRHLRLRARLAEQATGDCEASGIVVSAGV